jgi:hypothetical protein
MALGKLLPISTRGGREPNINALVRQVDDLTQRLNELSFGEPQDPDDPTSTTLAGGNEVAGTWAAGDHNGTPGNLEGSWVEVALTDTGASDMTCIHNLYLNDDQYAVPVTGEPNCRWLQFGVMHDGTGKDTSTRFHVSVSFVGGTVSANEIELRFDLAVSGTTPTISAGSPVQVTLWFTKASQGE